MMVALAGVARADDESKPASYTVAGEHGIQIDVTYQTLTGTYHEATRLVLHTAKARLVRDPPDPETPTQLPLIDKALVIDPDHWLLVGWSSTGGGMETMAAWIVAARGSKLRVTDELYWTSDRAHSGLAIESSMGKLRIGIPELPADGVHDRESWELRIGTKVVAFEKLTYVKSSSKLFAPPLDDAREPTARTAWFAVAGEKFVP
jgi:hypothetical protein